MAKRASKKKNANLVAEVATQSFKVGDSVWVVTPEHGFVEAKITKVTKPNSVSLQYVDEFIRETYGEDDVIYMGANLNKIKLKPKGAEGIRPRKWENQNRKAFPDWVTKTFLAYSSCQEKKKRKSNGFQLYDYQAFTRDYLGHQSPYSGLYLFFGLGTGKTCAAVAIAENLKDTRNIIVMLPASLKANFINQGLKKCGDPLYKEEGTGNKLIKGRYSFVSYNASNVVDQLKNLGTLDNKVIIVDEAHNLATMMSNGLTGMGKQGAEIYQMLMNAKNSKFIFLSGTPMVNTPFELAVSFNVLRGPLEVIVFTIRRYNEATTENFIGELIKNPAIGYADVDKRNRSLILFFKIKSWDFEFESTVRFVERIAREHGIVVDFLRTDKYPLFPEDEELFEKFFVHEGTFQNKTTFQRRILGIVSYYKGRSSTNAEFPALLPEQTVKVQMSNHQFDAYEQARDKEREQEKRSAYQRRVGQRRDEVKTPTLARVFSREFSNFVFPGEIIRPFNMFKIIVGETQEEREKREKKEKENVEKGIKEKRTKEQTDVELQKALQKLSDPKKPWLKPGPKGLDMYSPKMAAMLKEIQKDKEGLIFVYSAFRSVEGLEIFSRVLERNGFVPYTEGKTNPKEDYKRFSFYSGKESQEQRTTIKNVFTSPENKTGKQIRILLASSAGAEGLDLKNIRKILIMEPYWHEIRIRQVVGRGVRKRSHFDLPVKDRNVRVYRYLSVFTPEQLKRSKEKHSTDEYVLEVAKKKERLNQEVLQAVREAAVDCSLNQCANEMKGKCFKFAGKKEGIAFLPDLSKDIAFGFTQTETRKVKREIRVAALTDEDQLIYRKKKKGNWYLANGKKIQKKVKLSKKKVNKFALDVEKMEVYDYSTLKKTGDLHVVGKVEPETGKLILYDNKTR